MDIKIAVHKNGNELFLLEDGSMEWKRSKAKMNFTHIDSIVKKGDVTFLDICYDTNLSN